MKRRDIHQWLKDRDRNFYFKKAREEGYRARSAYKLLEIEEKFKILKGEILDLGCAPGAWLQVIKKLNKSNVYGIDLLPIVPISGVNFLQGDIFSKKVELFIKEAKFGTILCDIAPNCSGNKLQDHFNIMNVIECVFELVKSQLILGGNFCVKVFDGKEFASFYKDFKLYFNVTKIFKPKASNLDSCEVYLIGKDFKNV